MFNKTNGLWYTEKYDGPVKQEKETSKEKDYAEINNFWNYIFAIIVVIILSVVITTLCCFDHKEKMNRGLIVGSGGKITTAKYDDGKLISITDNKNK